MATTAASAGANSLETVSASELPFWRPSTAANVLPRVNFRVAVKTGLFGQVDERRFEGGLVEEGYVIYRVQACESTWTITCL